MDARKNSDLGNKEILARNLQNYLDLARKTSLRCLNRKRKSSASQ